MKYAIEKGLSSIGWPRPTCHVLGEANDYRLQVTSPLGIFPVSSPPEVLISQAQAGETYPWQVTLPGSPLSVVTGDNAVTARAVAESLVSRELRP